MQYSTTSCWRSMRHVLPLRLHLLAVLCFLTLVGLSQVPEVSAGWVVRPPVAYGACCRQRARGEQGGWRRRGCWSAGWGYLQRTWRLPLLRSALLAGLWGAAGWPGAWWWVLLPWLAWVGEGGAWLWPGLVRQPEWPLLHQALRWAMQGAFWVYVGLALVRGVSGVATCRGCALAGNLLCVGSTAVVVHTPEEERYHVALEGHLTLSVPADDPFRLRLLVLFLLLLEDPAEQRGSRRTRDGRAPVVCQEYLAGVLGIAQPVISRWERYWQDPDWRRLLSQKTPQLLTQELQQQIILSWAHWPSWGVREIRRLLVGQGMAVSEQQLCQAAQESGWEIVRQVLGRLCVQQGSELRLREDWLLSDLLAQVQLLLGKVEAGEQLTPEEHLNLAAWQLVSTEIGLGARLAQGAQPWLRSLEQVLFAPGAEVAAAGVRCPDCGSSHVGRNGLQPRRKQFLDEHGQLQAVEVYRYRCHNRACSRGSFTLLPAGLLPYSRQRWEVHVLALQMYPWGYSTYRRTGKALGVASMTCYRWVRAFGYQLLPIAALFGVVKSSGVVGADEKWVQVPKNNKPEAPRRKWMYVYLAVDVHTHDLLHIAIFPANTCASAQAFLFALRAKGYHPQVVVTDLRQDYGPAIARVFPQAQHHECLFHALQTLQARLADVYGWQTLHDTSVALTPCRPPSASCPFRKALSLYALLQRRSAAPARQITLTSGRL